MKKFWLIISFWLVIITGTIFWTISRYPTFAPTFPYHQTVAHLPRPLSILGNFDGVNYLRLSTHGYPSRGGEVAFFPLYPLLIRGFVNLGFEPLYGALTVTFLCLILFFLLVRKLYPAASSKFLWLFVSFPASFFLLSAYTESLFLLFFVAFLYTLKAKKWWLAGIIAGAASGTRLVGAIFGVMLLVEYFRNCHKLSFRFFLLAILSELGLLAYMYYLYQNFGDPLAFIHAQPQFGMGRSGGEIILLPQVLYRYGRMLLTVDIASLLYWRVLWELLTFLFFLFTLIKYWFKLTLIDRLYSTWVILLPTLSGTLSSFPRYALVAIPLFIVLTRELPPWVFNLLVILQALLLIASLSLFTRGLFVA